MGFQCNSFQANSFQNGISQLVGKQVGGHGDEDLNYFYLLEKKAERDRLGVKGGLEVPVPQLASEIVARAGRAVVPRKDSGISDRDMEAIIHIIAAAEDD